jgi:hypothetical protein
MTGGDRLAHAREARPRPDGEGMLGFDATPWLRRSVRSTVRRMRCVAALVLIVGVLALAACGEQPEAAVTYASRPTGTASKEATRLRQFAYKQMEKQSRETCRILPRKVLARKFGEASGDLHLGGAEDPAEWSDNFVALAYAEDVHISPIRLQQAAYDGCMAGLKDQR